MKNLLIVGASLLLLSAGIAHAATKKAPSKPPSEASLECSKQATEKGLKGKPRQAFRAKCMKSYKKA
ncbi:MAG: PsiF family protein [Hyphomicrobiaceae bacterium]|nr:PsiF family protein [Hyphomicrobiaceae bacterium]